MEIPKHIGYAPKEFANIQIFIDFVFGTSIEEQDAAITAMQRILQEVRSEVFRLQGEEHREAALDALTKIEKYLNDLCGWCASRGTHLLNIHLEEQASRKK